MAAVRSSPAPTRLPQRPARQRKSTVQHVDPSLRPVTRLSQRPPPRADTPLNGFSPDFDYIRANGSGRPRVQNFALPRSHSPIKQEEASSEYSDGSYDNMPRPAARRRGVPNHFMSGSNASMYDENFVEEMVNDNTKLKGIIWPGMDWFDSATAEMKRKRNQKKDVSVLLQLEATSQDTEAKEMVFRGGHLQVERDITGNIESEDSLIEGESEPEPDVTEKKPTRRRPRAPLADKNPNNGRLVRKSERRKAHRQPFGRQTRSPSVNLKDEDYEVRSKKTRKGLSIHRDNSGPDITFNQQPSAMNFLTAGFDNRSTSNHSRRSTPGPVGPPQGKAFQFAASAALGPFPPMFDSWGMMSMNQAAGWRPSPSAANSMQFGMSNFDPYESSAAQPRPAHLTVEEQFFGPDPHKSDSGHAAPSRPMRSTEGEQLFGTDQHPSHNENTLYQADRSTHENLLYEGRQNNSETFADMFTLNNNIGMQDMPFHGVGGINPLFLGHKSDDDDTISAPNSEH